LWPYAVRHANNIYNNVPLQGSEESPIERFTGVKISPQLRHFQHFGSPAYVLNNGLQQGQKAKKWTQRARIGVYLGQSMQHARTIMLILSLQSGNVSPQFHCQVDDTFSSIMGANVSLIPKSEWQYKAKLKQKEEQQIMLPPPRCCNQLIASHVEQQDLEPIVFIPKPEEQQNIELPMEDQQFVLPNPPQEPMEEAIPQPPLRHSTRERRPPAKHQDYIPLDQVAMPTIFEPSLEEYTHPFSQSNPLTACKAVRVSDPDTMYLWQAMKQPDWPQFKQAMQHEIDDHTSRGHWKIIKRTLLPKGASVLPAVWSMKRKRRIATLHHC
jgi:hypothetical protein